MQNVRSVLDVSSPLVLQGDTGEFGKPPVDSHLGCSIVAIVAAHQLPGVSELSQREVFRIHLCHPVHTLLLGVAAAAQCRVRFARLVVRSQKLAEGRSGRMATAKS